MEEQTRDIIKVDVKIMWLGISDAYDSDEITKEFYESLWSAIHGNAYPDKAGRRVIEYRMLMEILSKTAPSTGQLAQLWWRLGVSMACGLSVASEE